MHLSCNLFKTSLNLNYGTWIGFNCIASKDVYVVALILSCLKQAQHEIWEICISVLCCVAVLSPCNDKQGELHDRKFRNSKVRCFVLNRSKITERNSWFATISCFGCENNTKWDVVPKFRSKQNYQSHPHHVSFTSKSKTNYIRFLFVLLLIFCTGFICSRFIYIMIGKNEQWITMKSVSNTSIHLSSLQYCHGIITLDTNPSVSL